MPNNRILRISAEATWVATGQLVAFLGGFAAIKILTLQLGPAAYGQLALGISIAGVLHMFIYGPIEQAALRYVSVYRERGRLGLLFGVLRRVHARAAVIVAAVATLALIAAQAFAGLHWQWLILSAALLGMAGGVNATLSSMQSALRQRPAVALFQAADVWARLALACAGLLLVAKTADIALAGFCLASAATAATQLAWVATRPGMRPHLLQSNDIDPKDRRESTAELLAYGMPYVAFAGFAWLSTYGDRWIILMFAGETEVGIYAALFQIANAPITLFLGMTTQFLVPVIFARAGALTTRNQASASAKLLDAAVGAYAVAAAGIVAGAAVFAEPLVRLLTNQDFARHADLLWMLCAALALGSVGQLLAVKGLSRNRPQDYIVPKLVQVALLLLSAPLLIGPLGLEGMVMALGISGAGYVLAISMTNRRLSPVAS